MNNWFLVDYRFYADRVVSWNCLMNNGVTSSYASLCRVQRNLILEEFDEVCHAYTEQNKLNFLKELCDLFIVCSYMLYLKQDGTYESKGLFIANNKYGSPPLNTALSFLSDLVSLEDWKGVIKTVIGILNNIDANSLLALSKVCDNNASKFLKYLSTCERDYDKMAEQIEINSNGRYVNVDWYKSGDYVIFRDGDGKVMKPIGYKPVDLSECIKG